MSYTRHVGTSVSQTITIRYPKSDTGGSTSETVTIPIDVYVHVDTDRYDQNVDSCSRQIDLLTGAVVATEAAEIKAKRENSFKVGKSIISGFFGYVRSEISQQITELKSKVDSLVIHLAQLRIKCKDKERQMKSDFLRISSKYMDIFVDLDKNLHNQIAVLDAPAFNFTSELNLVMGRRTDNALLGTVAVTALENSALQSILIASSVKNRAQTVIQNANRFIVEIHRQKRSFESVKFEGNVSTKRYIPIIFTESTNLGATQSVSLYGVSNPTVTLSQESVNELFSRFEESSLPWEEISQSNNSRLSVYFNNQMNSSFATSSPYPDRVRELVQSMWKTNKLNVLSNN